jgi:diguanylate cyclase (GGDEF)-like protein
VAASVREWQVWTLAPVPRAYILGVVGLDWAVTVAALVVAPPRVNPADLVIYLGLLGCAVLLVETMRRTREVKGSTSRDLLAVWFLPIAILFPPGLAFLAPLALGIYRMRIRPAFLYRRVLTASTVSLGYGAASLAFHAAPPSIAGPAPQTGAHAVTWLLLAAGCYLLAWAVNNGLVLVAIRLATPEVRLREAFGGRTAWSTDLIELGLSVMAALVVAVAPVMIVLAVPPVVYSQRLILTAQLVSQIRFDAESGALAGVMWRSEAEADVSQARRTGRPLSVALAEIDDVPGLGGTAGPEAQRQVLRAVAAMLAGQVPPAAQVGRLGGGRFAILLPGVPEDGARRLGVRIRDQLAAEPVEVERDGQLDFVLRPTCSVGVAALSTSRQTVTELITAADVALGEARAAGGNQVRVVPSNPGAARTPAG